MQIINGVQNYRSHGKPLVLALGNFDGVHVGHQFLVKNAIGEARRIKGISAMMVFDPHPLKVLHPSRAPKLLTTLTKKSQLLEDLGLDTLIVTPFTKEIAGWSPEKFVEEILVNTLSVRAVFVGYNYSFGSKAAGDAAMMKALGERYNIDVHIIDPITVNEQVVSSTLVRKCLEHGDIEAVKNYTGRLPFLEGRIVEGEHRGKSLGYPTANMEIDPETVLPGLGVYAAKALIKGQTYSGVMNIGKKPTFHEDHPISAEIHLFGFDKDIYGEKIVLALVQKIRGEKRFKGVEELVQQIDADIKKASRILEEDSTEFDKILKTSLRQ